MRKTIKDVKIGDTVNNKKNGEGVVSGKTTRTITVTFKNGRTIKNRYRHNDDYFYETEF